MTAGPDDLADGTAMTVDDGSGPLRVIVVPSVLGAAQLGLGSIHLLAIGPLGQRDSTGSGTSGYRLFVAAPGDLQVAPPPTPTPTIVPTPTPTPTGAPDPTPTPTPTVTPAPGPSPTPSPTPAPSGPTIATARTMPAGTHVTVHGVVTAEPGRLGTPPLFAIADATAGIVVRLPSGTAPPSRGRVVTVTGPLADPYGQLEIRPTVDGLALEGTMAMPSPVDIPSSGPNENTEGRLVRLTGTATARPTKATSGDITIQIEMANGTSIRMMADASSGLGATSFTKGARYRLIGVAGQRASKKGELDGYRVWVRDRQDVTLLASAPTPGSSPGTPGGSATPRPALATIAKALTTIDRDVAIDAVVTAGAALLDSSGRRIWSRTRPVRSRSSSPRTDRRRPSGRVSGPPEGSARHTVRRGCGRSRSSGEARPASPLHCASRVRSPMRTPGGS